LNSSRYLLSIRELTPLVSYAIKALVGFTEQLGQCFLQVIEHGP
jgi:hypothetical protein